MAAPPDPASGRVHPQIAWAKLDTFVKSAQLAMSQL